MTTITKTVFIPLKTCYSIGDGESGEVTINANVYLSGELYIKEGASVTLTNGKKFYVNDSAVLINEGNIILGEGGELNIIENGVFISKKNNLKNGSSNYAPILKKISDVEWPCGEGVSESGETGLLNMENDFFGESGKSGEIYEFDNGVFHKYGNEEKTFPYSRRSLGNSWSTNIDFYIFRSIDKSKYSFISNPSNNKSELAFYTDNTESLLIEASGNTTITGTITAATNSKIGTLTLSDGSITDSSGNISFGGNDVSTAGTITAATNSKIGTLTLSDGSITDSSGNISFGGNDVSTAGTITAATNSKIGTLTLSDGSITDSNGNISFGGNDVSTAGTITAATNSKIGTLTLSNGSITDLGGNITFQDISVNNLKLLPGSAGVPIQDISSNIAFDPSGNIAQISNQIDLISLLSNIYNEIHNIKERLNILESNHSTP